MFSRILKENKGKSGSGNASSWTTTSPSAVASGVNKAFEKSVKSRDEKISADADMIADNILRAFGKKK